MPMRTLSRYVKHAAAVTLVLAACGLLLARSSEATERLRVGKAVPEAFSFVPLDVGMRKGFFAANGIEIESIAFTGDARMQQAMASDSIDIALGSGPAMAFIVKGSPVKAVAAMAGPPLLLAIVVRPDGPQTVADLKGAFMRKNKAQSVAIAVEVTNKDEEITSRVYEELMPMFSDNGKFNPDAMATLAKSYVELQLCRRSPIRQSSTRSNSCRRTD